jgi:hypothetical protein
MTKMVEVEMCTECPYFYEQKDKYGFPMNTRCREVQRHIIDNPRGEIPYWCPLPDKED